MILLFGTLEFSYYALIALLVLSIAGGSRVALAQQRLDLRRLERKLDALLKHHGVELPTRLSPEVRRLAKDVNSKIAAIKLHREQNPGFSLKEAKADVDDFAGSAL